MSSKIKVGANEAQAAQLDRLVAQRAPNTWRDEVRGGYVVGYWLDGQFWNQVWFNGAKYWVPEEHRAAHRSTATGWVRYRYGYTRVNEDQRHRWDPVTNTVTVE